MSARRSERSNSNISPESEHPDDLAHREYIRGLLTDSRRWRGFSATGFALEVGAPKATFSELENPEHTPSYWWRMKSVQKWAMYLNMQFTIRFGDLDADANWAYSQMMDSDAYWADLVYGRTRQPLNEGWLALEILKWVRRHRKITEPELADLMGIGRQSLQNIERTKAPRLSTIQRYTRALGGQTWLQVSLWTPKAEPR